MEVQALVLITKDLAVLYIQGSIARYIAPIEWWLGFL